LKKSPRPFLEAIFGHFHLLGNYIFKSFVEISRTAAAA
jgi:hypothetical protein